MTAVLSILLAAQFCRFIFFKYALLYRLNFLVSGTNCRLICRIKAAARAQLIKPEALPADLGQADAHGNRA